MITCHGLALAGLLFVELNWETDVPFVSLAIAAALAQMIFAVTDSRASGHAEQPGTSRQTTARPAR